MTISGESLVLHASESPPGEELARLFIGMIRSCFVAPLLFGGPPDVARFLHTYSNTPDDLLTNLESVTRTIRRANLQDELTLPSTEQAWCLHDPLTGAETNAVVTSYYGGISSPAHPLVQHQPLEIQQCRTVPG